MKSIKYKKTLIAALFVAGIWFLAFGMPFPYSFNHPDYHVFDSRISQLKGGERLDLTDLSKGRWKIACLFGGYTHPSEVMSEKGALSLFDSLYQPLKSWGLLRLGEVEEWESMIAYVDESNEVHFVHFGTTPQTDVYSTLEHSGHCTVAEKPWISYPKFTH